MTGVFISYRRDDCAAHAGRLCDRLGLLIGQDSVFMDVEAIEPGADFSARIADAIGGCRVVIVLIGDDWLDITDSRGRRRLEDPTDLVRHEIRSALKRDDVRVIPVLVEGAAMPSAEQLPDDLKPLAGRNALTLSDAGWRHDVERLIEVIERVVGPWPASAAATSQPLPTSGTSPRQGGSHAAASGGGRPGAGAGATGGAGRPADARNPRMVALAAAGAFVLMAGVLGALLTGGDDSEKWNVASTPESTQTQTQPATTGADKPIRLARRPNGITFANGALWVLSNPSPELVVLEAKTSTERNPVKIGTGGTAVTAGFGSIWVIKESTGMLIRLTLSGARAGSVRINATGRPVAVVAGAHAIWVGVREHQEVRSATLVKVDPEDPRRQKAIRMPDGLQNVAVGAGAAWVTATMGNKVVRIDARNTARKQNIPVGDSPKAVAVGQDAVWVANSGDDTISRIDPRTRKAKLWVRLDYRPTRLITGASSVWSTAQEANKLIRIDPDEPKILKEIPIVGKPFALEVTDRSTIWLTLLKANSVQRVRFKPRQRALRAR